MFLYIDTNIYLKFYHYSNDELEELRKLIVLIHEGQIKLFVTRQVVNEFYRNRETKIADALKLFKEEKLNNAFPVFLKEYDEFDKMRIAIAEYQLNKKRLLEKASAQIEFHNLKADEIMRELIEIAGIIEYNEEIVSKAKLRFDLGNPPGKKNSYGDALNWEILIAIVGPGNGFHFISDDKDFFSELDSSKFNNFLEREWQTAKYSKLNFYKSLSEFFKIHYPEIKLASEMQKDMYIERFQNSGSFRDSRIYLYRLAKFDSFNSEQINKIIEASIVNEQIFWISEDKDINELLFSLRDKYSDLITEDNMQNFTNNIIRIVTP